MKVYGQPRNFTEEQWFIRLRANQNFIGELTCKPDGKVSKGKSIFIPSKDLILSKDSSFFRSFQLDGLHRTPTELSQQNHLQEFAGGLNFRYQGKEVEWALAQTWTQWNYPLMPSNPLDWRGRNLLNTSLNYISQQRNVRITGEIAHTTTSAWSTIHALAWAINKKRMSREFFECTMLVILAPCRMPLARVRTIKMNGDSFSAINTSTRNTNVFQAIWMYFDFRKRAPVNGQLDH